MSSAVKIGVSACLLGEKVRYDGGHKLAPFIIGPLGGSFQFLPVCPEVGCGLPVPREPMRLKGDPADPRLVTVDTRLDLTDRMRRFCRFEVKELERLDLCGFIFKGNSPSCGLFNVEVHNMGMLTKSGRGLFAAELVRNFPLLPVVEERPLADEAVREDFIERVLGFRRWKNSTVG